MGAYLFLLKGALKNVTTSFADTKFTGLLLKRSSITFNTNNGVYWCLYPVNPIPN